MDYRKMRGGNIRCFSVYLAAKGRLKLRRWLENKVVGYFFYFKGKRFKHVYKERRWTKWSSRFLLTLCPLIPRIRLRTERDSLLLLGDFLKHELGKLLDLAPACFSCLSPNQGILMSELWAPVISLEHLPDWEVFRWGHSEFATYISIPSASLLVFPNCGFPALRESPRRLVGVYSKVLKASERNHGQRQMKSKKEKSMGEKGGKRRFVQNSFASPLWASTRAHISDIHGFSPLLDFIFSRENQVEREQHKI